MQIYTSYECMNYNYALLYYKITFDIHLNENKKSGYSIKTLPVAVSSTQ